MRSFLERFYQNHVLANLVFILVLAIGILSYLQMPREQDPEINFNWIDISTVVPGMAAEDIEKRVTDILEDGIAKVADIKFVSSTSRENISHILVRFNDISDRVFDKRLNDLRREIQNKEDELPDEAESPFVFEVTTANAYPTATIVVSSAADDENLRKQAYAIRQDVEQIKGVDSTIVMGLHEPELHIDFDPEALEALGLSPQMLSNTVALYYRDISAGSVDVGEQSWLVRMTGTHADPQYLAELPIAGPPQEVRIGDIADVTRSWEEPRYLVSHKSEPSVMLSITKQAGTNTLKLITRLSDFIETKNRFADETGVHLLLADDQTEITRSALRIMQTNALLGLILVLLTAWIFLGSTIAFLTAIGIPFILAGTIWLLSSMGQTLNVSILLGIVISLGMLVDDAVVIVEGIYYRLQRGMQPLAAVFQTLGEVSAPVTAAVMTTMAAFLPLMLLPGILGDFMKVIPLVVTTALAISLVEAFWMLPAHITAANVNFTNPGRIQRWREAFLHQLRIGYVRLLIKAMRYPKTLLTTITLLFLLALFAAFAGQVNPALMNNPVIKPFLVKTDFFASDPIRLFYVNIEMPNGTPVETTMTKVQEVEQTVRQFIKPDEARSIVSYAGQMFTEMAPFQGSHYGQVLVSLNPRKKGMREVDAVIDSMRNAVTSITGPNKIFFLRLSGGPPTSKPISVKVRGDNFIELRAATAALKKILKDSGWARDITDDDSPGLQEMVLDVNPDATRRTGITPDQSMRAMRMMIDGELVVRLQDEGEEVTVRVRARPGSISDIESLLEYKIPAVDGAMIPLSELLTPRLQEGIGNIRHYDFRRTITVESDIEKSLVDTRTANKHILDEWEKINARYPNISLDFSGELDDINESLGAMGKLMLFGLLLMYAILGTQFRSYFQPVLILVTVPMAFTGVVVGLLVTANPLSLYTLYGVVALAGIAVNAAIVLISAANARLASGMSVLHATLYAARRRVVPILITSTTTVAGLFSLATGLGGKSLLWGPVATAIVWGLIVSTILTLFVVPLLYRQSMRYSYLARSRRP
ncbi:MAG: efflux RND transporter permease subunit [Thiotrichales bacterium]